VRGPAVSGDAPLIHAVLNLSLILVTLSTSYREGFRKPACTMGQAAYSWPGAAMAWDAAMDADKLPRERGNKGLRKGRFRSMLAIGLAK
jgi:hypothetical protein